MNAGDIKVGLTLDNNSFKVEMQRAGVLIKQFQQNLESTSKSVKNIETHTSGFSARMRHAVTSISLARGALVNLNDLFLGIPRAVAAASGEIERMSKLMEGLAKSSKEVVSGNKTATETAKEWTGYVFEMSKNAPFEVNAITDSFVKLKTAGLDPTDGSLKALVDSVAKYGGTSEQLKRASVAIQQMGGKGVISMEELRQQLGEAVPDAIQLMATGVGMSMKDLVKKISLGQVEANSALDRMFTMMKIQNDGAARAMMETWTGQLSKLKTNITLMLNDIGNSGGENSFFAEIKNQLKELNELFDTPDAKRFAAEMGESLKTIAQALGSTIRFVIEYGSAIKSAALAVGIFLVAQKATAAVAKGADYYKAVTSAINEYKTASKALTESVIADNKAKAISAALETQRQLAAESAAAREKIAIAKATHAQMMADEIAFRAKYNAANTIAKTGRLPDGKFATAAVVEANRQQAISYMNAAVVAEKSMLRQEVAIKRLQTVQAGATAAMRANSQAALLSINNATNATVTMTQKLPLLGSALTLLGGPIGIITTALTAGAFAWMSWGSAAKDAVEQANRAIRDGDARNIDVKTVSDQIEAQKKVINQLANEGIATETGEFIRTATSEQIKAANDELLRLQRQHANAMAQARANEVNEAVRLNQKYNDRFLSQSRTRQDQELSALRADMEKQKGIATQKGGDLTGIELDFGRKIKDLAIKGAKERSDYLVRSIDMVSERIKTASAKEIGALKAQKDNLTKIKNDIDIELEAAKRLGSTNIMGGSDGNTAAKLSPIQKFIEKLKEQSEEVKRANEQLAEGKKAVKSYVDELDASLKSGKLNDKKAGSPTQAQLDVARELAAKLDADRAANAQLTAYNNFVDDLTGRIAALNGELSRNGGEGSVAKFFAKLKENGFEGEQLENAKRLVNEFQEAFEAKTIDQNIIQTEQAIAGLREELSGGAVAAGKMAGEIERLSKLELNKENAAQLERLKQLLAEQRDLGDVKVIREATARARQKTNEVLLGNATEKEAIRLRYEEELRQIEETYAKVSDVEKRKQEVRDAHNAEIKAANDRMAQEMRSPAERMVRQWQDATARMREASADWTNSFIDEMVNMAETGEFKFTDMVNSILRDMYRIALQKQIGGAVQGIFDSIGDAVSGAIQQGQAGGGGLVEMAKAGLEKFTRALGFGESKAEDLAGGMEETAAQAVVQATSSSTTAGALKLMTGAANLAANALQQLASSAGAQSQMAVAGGSDGGGFLSGLGGIFGGMFGGSDVSPSASYGGMLGMGESSGGGFFSSLWPFANGGIMSKYGSAPLRKYANGGIATSPQLALYGEGSRPEAYVPLPDGRTIPVTMSGMVGGGSNVVVNVINNASGTQAREERSQNADGSMNIDVIIEQVEGKLSQNLSKGKGSLSTVMEKTYGLNRAAGSYR